MFMMKDNPICKETGMLLIRVALAVVFILHGWEKVADMPKTVLAFEGMGFSAFWAYLVAWVELLGGVAMLLGVWTKCTGYLLAIIMAVAIYVVKGMGMGLSGGYEFNVVLLLVALGVAFTGPGEFTVKKLLGKA